MTPVAACLLSGALAYAGFSAVCASMVRHQHSFRAGPMLGQAGRRALWAGGFGLLGSSVLPCLLALGGGLGFVTWTALLTAAALPVSLGLSYLARPFPLAGPVLALTVSLVVIGLG